MEPLEFLPLIQLQVGLEAPLRVGKPSQPYLQRQRFLLRMSKRHRQPRHQGMSRHSQQLRVSGPAYLLPAISHDFLKSRFSPRVFKGASIFAF
jgi:hypothetical protein